MDSMKLGIRMMSFEINEVAALILKFPRGTY